MKKLVMMAMAAAAVTASAGMKLGTVDLLLLVRNHPDYERNQSLLATTDKDYQKRLETFKGDGEKLQEEGKQLAEQLRNPMLSAKAKEDVEKQIMDLQKRMMGVEQQYRAEAMRCRQALQDLEATMRKTTLADLRKRVTAFAEKNGYDMIFDTNAAPYSKPSFEVTSAILKEMGVEEKDVKGRDEGK